MKSEGLDSLYQKHPIFQELLNTIEVLPINFLVVKNLLASSKAIITAMLFQKLSKNFIVLLPDKEQAHYFFADLNAALSGNLHFFFPDSYVHPLQFQKPDLSKIQEKTEALEALLSERNKTLLVSYPEAILEKVTGKDSIKKNQLEIAKGSELSLDFLCEVLYEYGFEKQDFVYDPGTFSVRGGIIDVYSFNKDLPYRIEMDGSIVESIRLFNPNSQLSEKEMGKAYILPNIIQDEIKENKTDIFQVIDKENTVFVMVNSDLCFEALAEIDKRVELETDIQGLQDIYVNSNVVDKGLGDLLTLDFSTVSFRKPDKTFSFNISPQQVFKKNFKLLIKHLNEQSAKGYENLFFSSSHKQMARLDRIFEDLEANVHLEPHFYDLSEGFTDHDLKISCFAEHQIFDRHYQYRSKKRFSRSKALTLRELQNLNPGDFVVHIDHGIGVFEGLQKMEMGGRRQDAVRIKYKNGDLLYVNISSLYKISKFSNADGKEPKINKLGSDTWQKLKSKTKSKVKDIARDLIKLYAKRRAQQGFQFGPDNYLQMELEASFMYEDTPDQAKASDDVKNDMQSTIPMDRLVCGDVGFGKTEVAIRAAFKAVLDGKQVAILVPTTILAQQHYYTFKKRFEDFPVTVDFVNRFRTAKEQRETLENLKNGKVDIIIGTHRLLNKNIAFKDLGLLVVDEEQKFGVSAKEKLKNIRVNVDTLTLTATPIPRTLHFSLMGARDLSIINTPPPNRIPVQTEVHTFSKEMIEMAIKRELDRGGQVFFVHNKVKDIYHIADLIASLVPKANIGVGHGQMSGNDLEDVMMLFINGELDVLVSTTIIEAGLDISNANTIIINNAHYFGLSDLHQMRGRVGRNDKKAYCYLLAPPLLSLSEDARKRLRSLEEFSDLGSGFQIAMRDLDIRGAGNLLGAEQSGFISEVGMEMYHKILDEAITELKENEFQDLLEDEKPKTTECIIETDIDAQIPDSYISNISERLLAYTEISKLKTTEDLESFKVELKDRFGKFPSSLLQLFELVHLKWMGEKLNLKKIKLLKNTLHLYFPDGNDEKYYQSEKFSLMLKEIAKMPQAKIKQKGGQLKVVFENVNSLDNARRILGLFSK